MDWQGLFIPSGRDTHVWDADETQWEKPVAIESKRCSCHHHMVLVHSASLWKLTCGAWANCPVGKQGGADLWFSSYLDAIKTFNHRAET